jgi:hypothetical protein
VIDGAALMRAIINDTDLILRGKKPQDPTVAAIVDEVRAQVPASDVRLHIIWKALLWNAFSTAVS